MNRVTLEAIGYWRLPGSYFSLPHPAELQNYKWNIEAKKSIVHYLLRGMVIMKELSPPISYLDSHTNEYGRSHEILTDGVWFWPKSLAYFVENHNIMLPQQFIELANDRDSNICVLRPEDSIVFSFDFWLRWCRQVRSNRFYATISRFFPRATWGG
jgi:hypothetical protein